MPEWINEYIFEIITAIIALYAAGLSTAVFITNLREKKPRLKVTTETALAMSSFGSPTEVVMGTVSNIGHRNVQICGFSLLRGDGQQLVNPHNNCSNPTLPHILQPGEQLKAWFDYAGVLDQLRSENIETMTVQMRFLDGAGKHNRSKHSITLNTKTKSTG